MEGFGQIMCSLILGVAFWEMDDNSDELIGGQLTRPTYDKFLCFAVKVSLPERKWVQGMKKLRDLVDTQLNCIVCGSRCHVRSGDLPESISGRLSWPRSEPGIHPLRRVG